MKIGFGCDHAAVDLKDKMIAYMKEKGEKSGSRQSAAALAL